MALSENGDKHAGGREEAHGVGPMPPHAQRIQYWKKKTTCTSHIPAYIYIYIYICVHVAIVSRVCSRRCPKLEGPNAWRQGSRSEFPF